MPRYDRRYVNFIKRVKPIFPYVVNIAGPIRGNSEPAIWAQENLGKDATPDWESPIDPICIWTYVDNDLFFFKHEDDAIHFKLKFG